MKEYKKYKESDKGTFSYWFAHWRAYNSYAIEQGVWKPKYLFHDAEKPWLRLVMNYEKAKNFHRSHNRHHLEYEGNKPFDYDAMILDWEVSRFTKEDATMNSIQTMDKVYERRTVTHTQFEHLSRSIRHILKNFTVCIKLREDDWKKYVEKIPALKEKENLEENKGLFLDKYMFLEFENGERVKTGWSDKVRGTELKSDEVFSTFFE